MHTTSCPNGHAAASFEKALALHQQCVLRRFGQLPVQRQAELMKLFSWDKYDDPAGNTTIYGIYQTNSLKLTGKDTGDGGLFPVMCRMNHSCCPNVKYIWRPDLQKLVLAAQRDITCGEELYTTYGVGGHSTTAGRRAHLLKEFGFHCMCPLCVKSDTKSKVMKTLTHDRQAHT